MKRPFRPLLLVSLLAGVLIFGPLPVAAQRASLLDRVEALERRAGDDTGAARANLELLDQIIQLRAELGALRGEIEILQQQGAQLRATLRSQHLDLDERIQALERAAIPAPPEDTQTVQETPPSAPEDTLDAANAAADEATDEPSPDAADLATSAEPLDERVAYENAFDALKAGHYRQSAQLFQEFLQHFPDGEYAANAGYWLGESYYVMEDYANAQLLFETVIEHWPEHDKASAALLKVGLSQYGQKHYDAAEKTLREVGQRHPGTDAARTAADRLRAIELSRLN